MVAGKWEEPSGGFWCVPFVRKSVLKHSGQYSLGQHNPLSLVHWLVSKAKTARERLLEDAPGAIFMSKIVVPRAGFEASFGGQARTPLRLSAYGGDSGCLV